LEEFLANCITFKYPPNIASDMFPFYSSVIEFPELVY
jgi:hypothetical protein